MPQDLATLLTGSRFRVVRVEEPRRDGNMGTREVVRHPGAVTILPLLDDGSVCLIRNYRVAIDETLVELPAGTLEPGEDPMLTAQRELQEETGYRASQWKALRTFVLSPGILDEVMHLYLATGLTAGPANREPGEQIENLIVSWDDAISRVADGTIRDAKTIVGLLSYDRWGPP